MDSENEIIVNDYDDYLKRFSEHREQCISVIAAHAAEFTKYFQKPLTESEYVEIGEKFKTQKSKTSDEMDEFISRLCI